MNPPSNSIRLNKFLAERLGVSRREADSLIANGKVTINGVVASLGARIPLVGPSSDQQSIDKNTKVCYNGKIVPLNTEFLYLALNKPVGYLCSRRSQGGAPTVYELLPVKYHHLKTVGRLDRDSSGLILLTNDGDFAFRMTHPKFHKEKIYEVQLNKSLAPLHQQMISDFGIEIGDGPSRFTVIKKDANTDGLPTYIVILSEGRNRQIRRTFAALGYVVTRLHRTKFGIFELGNLSTGKFQLIPDGQNITQKI